MEKSEIHLPGPRLVWYIVHSSRLVWYAAHHPCLVWYGVHCPRHVCYVVHYHGLVCTVPSFSAILCIILVWCALSWLRFYDVLCTILLWSGAVVTVLGLSGMEHPRLVQCVLSGYGLVWFTPSWVGLASCPVLFSMLCIILVWGGQPFSLNCSMEICVWLDYTTRYLGLWIILAGLTVDRRYGEIWNTPAWS